MIFIILIVAIVWYMNSGFQRNYNIVRQLLRLEDVIVLGQGGAGKSTLCKQLAEAWNSNWQPLDKFAYKPDKEYRYRNETVTRGTFNKEATQSFDSIYMDPLDPNKARQTCIDWLIENKHVDCIIWIDEAMWIRLDRTLKRSVLRYIGWEPQTAGNVETLYTVKGLLTKEWNTSILTWNEIKSHWALWRNNARVQTIIYYHRSDSHWFNRLINLNRK